MAFVHGSSTRVLIDGNDLSAYFRSASTPGTRDVAESTSFNDTAKTYITGLTDATISLEGMYDGAASAVDEVMAAAFGGTSIYTVLHGTNTIGTRGHAAKCINNKYEVKSPISDLSLITAEGQSTVGFDAVVLHQPLSAITAAGTSATVVDNSASSANGGVAYLHATALTGAGPVVKIQDSADDVTYADLITFDAISAANTAQRVTVTGTVDRYTRATWAAGTATFNAAFGRY